MPLRFGALIRGIPDWLARGRFRARWLTLTRRSGVSSAASWPESTLLLRSLEDKPNRRRSRASIARCELKIAATAAHVFTSRLNKS